jgi:hypothetical protein
VIAAGTGAFDFLQTDVFFKFAQASLSFENVGDLFETEHTDTQDEKAERTPEKKWVQG